MRKYRGLTKKGKWVYGYYIQMVNISIILPADYLNNDRYSFYGLDEEDNVFEMSSECIEVIPETVGQFTGLKDKNGKGDEVYKDDIVSSFNGINYLVYYDTEYGQWWGRIINKTKGKYTRPLCEILDNSYMKIIGNIHQSELMEQNNG